MCIGRRGLMLIVCVDGTSDGDQDGNQDDPIHDIVNPVGCVSRRCGIIIVIGVSPKVTSIGSIDS